MLELERHAQPYFDGMKPGSPWGASPRGLPSFKPSHLEIKNEKVPGRFKIRVRDNTDAYRVMYVTKLSDAVHVIHCFQKKTGKTSKADIDLVSKRYRDLLQGLNK